MGSLSRCRKEIIKINLRLTAGPDQPLYEDKYYFITLHLPLHSHSHTAIHYTQRTLVPTPTKVGKVHVGGDMTR